RGSLVGLEPDDPALERGIGGRHASLVKHKDSQPCAVAVAGRSRIVGRPIAPLPRPQRGQAPASVAPLRSPQGGDGCLLLIAVHQTIKAGGCPQEHRLVVQVGSRCFPEIVPKLLQSSASGGSLSVAIRSMAGGKGPDDRTVIVVMLERRPAAFQPVPGSIGL